MFYHLEGIVSDIEQNLAVIDCNGVGYAINTTVNTLSQIRLGEKHKLYITESVGETNFDLYGFAGKQEKRCFEMLISVSGIGPKAALSILSCNTPDSLTLAILNNDEKALTVAPGIGKKIAQRVILELKDKIGKETSLSFTGTDIMPHSAPTQDSTVNDAIAALTVLGYSSSDIAPVLKKIDISGMSAEQIIKAVLKQMVR